MAVVAISMDTRERATQFSKDVITMVGMDKLQIPIAYGLT
jgi:hypothetical protein